MSKFDYSHNFFNKKKLCYFQGTGGCYAVFAPARQRWPNLVPMRWSINPQECWNGSCYAQTVAKGAHNLLVFTSINKSRGGRLCPEMVSIQSRFGSKWPIFVWYNERYLMSIVTLFLLKKNIHFRKSLPTSSPTWYGYVERKNPTSLGKWHYSWNVDQCWASLLGLHPPLREKRRRSHWTLDYSHNLPMNCHSKYCHSKLELCMQNYYPKYFFENKIIYVI